NPPRARGLKEASEELEYLKMSDEERRQYERFIEKRRYDATMYESTYVKGWNEGEQKSKQETAKSLKKFGIAVEIISESTGLTAEEIEKL
ncbi:MAG: hypothetical protein B0D92_04760, partial [Spirochaeta sp. LUC14_002_19_P3]